MSFSETPLSMPIWVSSGPSWRVMVSSATRANAPSRREAVRGQEVAQGERALAGLPLGEVDLGLRVLGLGVQDGLDPVGQLGGHPRERQAGGGALTDGAAPGHAAPCRAAPGHYSPSSRWDTMSA